MVLLLQNANRKMENVTAKLILVDNFVNIVLMDTSISQFVNVSKEKALCLLLEWAINLHSTCKDAITAVVFSYPYFQFFLVSMFNCDNLFELLKLANVILLVQILIFVTKLPASASVKAVLETKIATSVVMDITHFQLVIVSRPQ